MLTASIDIEKLLDRAKELKFDSLALTEYGNLFNTIKFYKEAKKRNIKPILGCVLFLCQDIHENKQQKIRKLEHITLLAENQVGWKNLVRLVSNSYKEENFYFFPRIDFKLLEKYKEGLILLSGGLRDSIISNGLLNENPTLIKSEGIIRRLLKIFDNNHFFIEVQNDGSELEIKVNNILRNIAKKYQLKTIATNNIHYLNKEDAEAHKTLLKMNPNEYNKVSQINFDKDEYYLKSREEMVGFLEEELNLTSEIANRCNIEIDLKKNRLPKYKFLPSDKTPISYLRELSFNGLSAKTKEYTDRLERELKDIEEMGFADYFLIVQDILQWCRRQGMLLGPGRGSVGGSLCAYSLGITEIDPIKYNLIWERFLNKGRIQLPDIDSDVPRSKRKEVLDYIKERFGNVAQLINFNGLQARAILKEVFRVFNLSFDEANKITNLIPAKNDDHTDISIEEALEKSEELRSYEKKYKSWFEIAKSLEGCYKNTGIHAAAVIISDCAFEDSDYLLARSKDGEPIFGWDMDSVDDLHLLKLDVLGISTLDDIQETFKLIEERHKIKINRNSIPLNNSKTFDLFNKGHTVGVFQLETQLGRNWSKKVSPTKLTEIADLVSLLRPATLDCLTGDTKILISIWNGNKERGSKGREYKYKTINQLFDEYTRVVNNKYGGDLGCKPKLQIISLDEKDHNLVKNKIIEIQKTGIKKVYNIKIGCFYEGSDCRMYASRTRKTFNIKASENHKFLTLNGWKTLKELNKNDYICILNKGFGVKRKLRNNTIYGKRNFRNIAFNNYQYNCCFCDWTDGSLDVNHIDGNKFKDNDAENLSFLCPNHHRMYTEGSISKEELLLAREKYRMPFTKDILFVRFIDKIEVGEFETFDIRMSGPNHNFIADDFIVHNSGLAKQYVDTKNGKMPFTPAHPLLADITKDTYGVLCYQEQTIFACQKLANFSLNEADSIRKVIGKKKPEELKEWKPKFINGCIKNNIDKVSAEDIWSQLEKFAGYQFNFSHGLAYSMLSYETAYLKANYPIEFFCAKLKTAKDHPDKFERIGTLIYDAKLFGIKVSPPRNTFDFTILNNNEIAFGLSSIKGIGKGTAKNIISLLSEVKSFDEFILKSQGISSSAVEGLIKSGALDLFKIDRIRMWAKYSLMRELTAKELEIIKSENRDWIQVLNDLTKDDAKIKFNINRAPDIRRKIKINEIINKFCSEELFDNNIQNAKWEIEFLGLSITKTNINGLDRCIDVVQNSIEGDDFDILVEVNSVRQIVTQKGYDMAFISAKDDSYLLDNIVIFPKIYDKYKNILVKGNIIRIRGKIDSQSSFLANKIERYK